MLLDHQSGSKGSLQTQLQYYFLYDDYLTQLNVLHTYSLVNAALKSMTLWHIYKTICWEVCDCEERDLYP